MSQELIAVKGIENVPVVDLMEMIKTSNAIGFNPNWLAAIIAFETAGSWDPAKKNPLSSATGLIQFLSSTAKHLGTTIQELASMTFTQQLEYVKKYFQWVGAIGKTNNLEDAYLWVFYPKAVGHSNDWVVANEGDPVYEQNKGFDFDGKGYITRGNITSTIRSVYNAGVKKGIIEVPFLWELLG